MTTTPSSLLTGAYVGATATVLYTSPVGTQTMVSKFTLTNVTGSSVTVTINLSTSNVTNTTSPLQTLTVPANSTVVVSTAQQHIVPPNGALIASASTGGAVIAKISGVQFS